MEEINSTPIEPQRKQSTAYWMGQVDATLIELRNLFEKSINKNEENWRDERAWRVTISSAMHGFDQRLFALEPKSSINPPTQPLPQSPLDEQLEKKVVTWKWITDKLAAPVIVAVVIFLLINLFPQIIAHLANP